MCSGECIRYVYIYGFSWEALFLTTLLAVSMDTATCTDFLSLETNFAPSTLTVKAAHSFVFSEAGPPYFLICLSQQCRLNAYLMAPSFSCVWSIQPGKSKG